jgi:excisionase family DNA binding protein
MDNQYLTFDEAVAFLKTNTSTLYKWLQSGKVPGHKLGRQWRFVREELEAYLSGNSEILDTRAESQALADFLGITELTAESLLLALIRDAETRHAVSIHFAPARKGCDIVYRINGSMKKMITIAESLFERLHRSFIDLSTPLQDNDARRAMIKNGNKQIQIQSQKIATLNGTRITLRIVPNNIKLFTLDKITSDAATKDTFTDWLKQESGIIFVSGLVGNGMTTVTCSFLGHLQNQGKNVFLIQDYPEILFPEISTIDVTPDDATHFSRVLQQVMISDADAIGITLSPASDLEPHLFKAAFRAASKGHLVIVQYNAVSAKAVIEKINKYAPDIIENKINFRVSHQTLVAMPDNKRRAEFTLLET